MIFHANNEQVHLVSDTGGDVDKLTLYLLDVNTGEKVYVASDPKDRVDFGSLWLSEKTREIFATTYEDDRTRIYFHDDDFEQLHQRIRSELGDVEIAIVSSTRDDAFLLVAAYSDIEPSSVYICHTENQTLTYQYTLRPGLSSAYMSSMHPIRYLSSDGLEIPAYLTLPRGFGKTELPLLVMPHSGPGLGIPGDLIPMYSSSPAGATQHCNRISGEALAMDRHF